MWKQPIGQSRPIWIQWWFVCTIASFYYGNICRSIIGVDETNKPFKQDPEYICPYNLMYSHLIYACTYGANFRSVAPAVMVI